MLKSFTREATGITTLVKEQQRWHKKERKDGSEIRECCSVIGTLLVASANESSVQSDLRVRSLSEKFMWAMDLWLEKCHQGLPELSQF